MKVATFNQEKALVGALVGAFSVIVHVQLHRLIVYSTTPHSIHSTLPAHTATRHKKLMTGCLFRKIVT